MNLFKHLESARTFPPRRILLYGLRGIGTSTFAAGLPSPVFAPADDSVSHIACPRFPAAKRFADLMQALQELYIEPHEYRTVVLDPLDAVELLIRDEVCRDRNAKHLADVAHAGGYVFTYWRRLLRRLDLLRSDIDLHVVLVGHAQEAPAQPTHGDGPSDARHAVLLRCYAPAVARRVSALLQSWCDEVPFATFTDVAASTETSPSDPAMAVPQGVSQSPLNQRVIYTTPSPGHAAKNHLNLPPRLRLRPDALVPHLASSPAAPHAGPPSLS